MYDTSTHVDDLHVFDVVRRVVKQSAQNDTKIIILNFGKKQPERFLTL